MAGFIRRVFALLAASALVGLGLLSAVHIHGVSDPDTPHTSTDYFLAAQTAAGFTTAPVGPMVGWALVIVAVLHLRSRQPGLLWRAGSCFTRAPPA
ncbi:MAG TPA: hypothetical protein VGK88_05955 [bacterium]